DFLGIHATGASAEADDARCLISPAEADTDLSGQLFRYSRIEARAGTQILMKSPSGDALVTSRALGRGRVIFCALPDFLGEDERITPFVAHMLAHLFSNATPVRVRGDVEYLINRTERGWV